MKFSVEMSCTEAFHRSPPVAVAAYFSREIGPAHFPSANATYKNFQDLPESEQSVACCTGTPPLHLERNLVGGCLAVNRNTEDHNSIVCNFIHFVDNLYVTKHGASN